VNLFEFTQIEEGISKVLNVGGVVVLINDHLYDQAEARNISSNDINAVIKKIPHYKKKIDPLDENTKFQLWSDLLHVGIGLRKRLDRDGYMRVEVVTAINKKWDSGTLMIRVG